MNSPAPSGATYSFRPADAAPTELNLFYTGNLQRCRTYGAFPPLATQQAIVAAIEAEQTLVAANRELLTRFEQKIQATLARIWGEEKTP